MNRKSIAVLLAFAAAVLYAINIPFSKILLNDVEPTMMASYLYLGAGLGIGALCLLTQKRKHVTHEKFTAKDLPYVIGMIVLDILAPILLMFGLMDSASSSASLLNNFEIVCTAMIALLLFREAVSKRMWVAIILITVSGFVLSFENIRTFTFSKGAVMVLAATLCWGFENNCTKNLTTKNTFHVVFLKGIFSGLGALIVAICLKEPFASIGYIALAMLLGFVAYGLSIYCYIKAQGVIGAAKTSAYYSVAPFVGTFLSCIIFREALSPSYFVSLALMIAGTVLVVADTLSQQP